MISFNNWKKFNIKSIIGLREFGVSIALIILCSFLSIASPYFLTTDNIFNVLRQISIYAILAVGQALCIICGCMDLSIGNTMGLLGIIGAYLSATFGLSAYLILPLVLIAGAIWGSIIGILVTKVGVNPFITTLGMSYIAKGLSLFITNGGYAIRFDNELTVLGGGYIGPIPVPVIIMIGIAALGTIFTKRTLHGRNIYAVGSNEKAAKLSGIRPDNIRISVYIIMGILVGISSIILTGTLKSADPIAGQGSELQTIAAVVIGGTAFTGGEGSILGVVIGAALMGVLRNGYVLLSLPGYWQVLSLGIVVILAVSVDAIKSKRRQK